MEMQETFSRTARRVRRHKVANAPAEDRWILKRMATELLERWQNSQTVSGAILIIGNDVGAIAAGLSSTPLYADACPSGTEGQRIVICDEDRLPFADFSFAAIFSVGMIDTVNDVPGSLILARRCLKPGGLFLGAYLGVGTGQTLRSIVQTVTGDEAPRVRMHPQIDVRAAGDLMARAGFAKSVADMETVKARYSSWDRLMGDFKANSGGNALMSRSSVTQTTVKEWKHRFEARKSGEGRVTETFCPIYVTGYAPS